MLTLKLAKFEEQKLESLEAVDEECNLENGNEVSTLHIITGEPLEPPGTILELHENLMTLWVSTTWVTSRNPLITKRKIL